MLEEDVNFGEMGAKQLNKKITEAHVVKFQSDFEQAVEKH